MARRGGLFAPQPRTARPDNPRSAGCPRGGEAAAVGPIVTAVDPGEAPITAFAFAIPLRSQSTSRNWAGTVKLFKNTLRSVLRQSDPNFRVFVSCHEIPPIAELLDPRVEVIEAHWLATAAMPMADKRHKLAEAARRWREEGGGYLMHVDADDLINRDLVAYALTHLTARGFVIERGYEYDARTGLLSYAPRFHRLCGSSIAVNWGTSELPSADPILDDCLYRALLDVGHARAADMFAGRGEPLEPFPFMGAIYVRNHGDNISAVTKTDGWRRKLLRLVMPQHVVTEDIQIQFGLTAPAAKEPEPPMPNPMEEML
jgi:hypothetical protein